MNNAFFKINIKSMVTINFARHLFEFSGLTSIRNIIIIIITFISHSSGPGTLPSHSFIIWYNKENEWEGDKLN